MPIEGSVWGSPLRPENTGVGVFQRELYKRLAERGIFVSSPAESSRRSLRALRCFAQVVSSQYAAAIVCATPAPFLIRTPVVAIVYDLRWRRTRGRYSQMYRYIDLRRIVSRADQIFTISQRTLDEVTALFPSAERKCSVLHLGPGIARESDFVDGESGVVLLIGSAKHKRNELVAEALVKAQPEWADRFLCVGVSDLVYRTLAERFGESSCERFDHLDDDRMRLMFRRARVYVSASTEEGFGLPMVEALTAGCQVVAIRQPLTAEIVGDAGVLINDGDVAEIGRQLRCPTWVAEPDRRTRAAMYSWDEVAARVSAALDKLDA